MVTFRVGFFPEKNYGRKKTSFFPEKNGKIRKKTEKNSLSLEISFEPQDAKIVHSTPLYTFFSSSLNFRNHKNTEIFSKTDQHGDFMEVEN
jgi:hypothetical protein